MKTIALCAAIILAPYAAAAQSPSSTDASGQLWISTTNSVGIVAKVVHFDLVLTARDGQQLLVRGIDGCKEIADALVRSADVTRAKCYTQ